MLFKGRNRVTQAYGGSHGGIDIVGDDDKTINSPVSGKVTTIYKWNGKITEGDTNSYGNLVIVTADNGYRHYFAHLNSFLVSKGQRVSNGTPIGVMGNTGNCRGAHLHYEVRKGILKSSRIDPSGFANVSNAKGTYLESDIKIAKTYQVFCDLNVRSAPNGSKVVGSIKAGSFFNIHDRKSDSKGREWVAINEGQWIIGVYPSNTSAKTYKEV